MANLALMLTTATDGGGTTMIMTIGMIVVLVVVMIFSFRKQKKQDQEVATMRNNLQVGDEVTTIGGIIGKVVSIKDETCVIETSLDCTKIRILKSAISRVDVKAEDAAN